MVSSRGLGDVYKRQDEDNKSEQIERLKTQIQQQKNKEYNYREELESYFLLWVHQIKIPITASKLLLERKDDNQNDRLKQEIFQIDNYTNLALNYLKIMNDSTDMSFKETDLDLSLIHISEPTRRHHVSRMPSSA